MFCSLGKKKKKNAAAELFCNATLKSKRCQSEVLITEMTREVTAGAEKMENDFSSASEADLSRFREQLSKLF